MIDNFTDDRQEHCLVQIACYEGRAAKYLVEVLKNGRFRELPGEELYGENSRMYVRRTE